MNKLRNLTAEMERNGISVADLAHSIGKTEKTIRNKIYGKSEFLFPETIIIRNTFFPKSELEYLFQKSEIKSA